MPVSKCKSKASKVEKSFKAEVIKNCKLEIEEQNDNISADTSKAETSFVKTKSPIVGVEPFKKHCETYDRITLTGPLPSANKKYKFSSVVEKAKRAMFERCTGYKKRDDVLSTETANSHLSFFGKYQLSSNRGPFYCYEVDDLEPRQNEVVFQSSDEKYVVLNAEKAAAASPLVREMISTALNTPLVWLPFDTDTLIKLGSWIFGFSVKEHTKKHVSPTIDRMQVTSCQANLLPSSESELLKLADAAAFLEITSLFDACIEKLANKLMYKEMPPRDVYKFCKMFSAHQETFTRLVYRKIVLESIAVVYGNTPYPVPHRNFPNAFLIRTMEMIVPVFCGRQNFSASVWRRNKR